VLQGVRRHFIKPRAATRAREGIFFDTAYALAVDLNRPIGTYGLPAATMRKKPVRQSNGFSAFLGLALVGSGAAFLIMGVNSLEMTKGAEPEPRFRVNLCRIPNIYPAECYLFSAMCLKTLVGVRGIEPPTPASRRLRNRISREIGL
jgi:hypothetical protein